MVYHFLLIKLCERCVHFTGLKSSLTTDSPKRNAHVEQSFDSEKFVFFNFLLLTWHHKNKQDIYVGDITDK